jgi:hypothetical protein
MKYMSIWHRRSMRHHYILLSPSKVCCFLWQRAHVLKELATNEDVPLIGRVALHEPLHLRRKPFWVALILRSLALGSNLISCSSVQGNHGKLEAFQPLKKKFQVSCEQLPASFIQFTKFPPVVLTVTKWGRQCCW